MPLATLLLDICLLRAGPQQLPASRHLVRLALLAYVAVGVVVIAPAEGLLRALGQSLLDTGVLLGLLWAALAWRRHPARFGQAATALAGTGALLGLLLLPIAALGGQEGWARELAALLWLGLFAWSLAVTGHILRHTLELPLAGGVLAAAVYVVLSLALIGLLFPQAT